MLQVHEAIDRIRARCSRLTVESVPLGAALGRALAVDLRAEQDLPPFDNSAMDGYCVHVADLLGASPESPVALMACEQVITAGPCQTHPLPPGHAARIMTGAALPPGAEAVVPVEHTARSPEGQVLFMGPVKPQANRRCRGSDLKKGVLVLPEGTLLGTAELAILGALGWAQVPTIRRPRVAVVTTGDELVPVAATPACGQIRDSSSVVLPLALAQAGAEVVRVEHAVDSAERLSELLGSLAELDLVVTVGGVSMGDRDLVRPTFERLGQVDFWRVAIKPGKPLLFGSLGPALFFGLPGNPASSMVCLDVFVRPALDELLGRRGGRVAFAGRWSEGVRSDCKRTEYVRVVASPGDEGLWTARPTGDQGSGMLTSMLGANAYGVIPLGTGEVAAGDVAQIELLEPGVVA